MPTSFHRRGFSLAELLVGTAILGLLVAVALPAGAAANRSVRRVAFANNLRQIGQAVTAYRSAHRAWPDAAGLPEPFVPRSVDGRPALNAVLAFDLPPASGAYRCPADPRVWAETAAASRVGAGISYAYLYSIWHHLSQEQKARFPVMSDAAGGGRYAGGVTWRIDPPHAGGSMNRLYNGGSVDSYVPGS